MKKLLLLMFVFGFFFKSNSKNIQISQLTSTSINGGINVNVKAMSGNGAGYIGYNYSIVGNIINLDVCYWFNFTLPILFFDNDCFIPLSTPGNYTINVRLYNSISQVVCDYYTTTSNQTISRIYLSASEFEKSKNEITFFPNPTSGEMHLKSTEIKIINIDIYDSFGRNVKKIVGNIANTYNLSDLSDGIYFAKTVTEIGVLNQKIVLKK